VTVLQFSFLSWIGLLVDRGNKAPNTNWNPLASPLSLPQKTFVAEAHGVAAWADANRGVRGCWCTVRPGAEEASTLATKNKIAILTFTPALAECALGKTGVYAFKVLS
jgi:hypothetical protein